MIGSLQEYRRNARQTYQTFPIPTNPDQASRMRFVGPIREQAVSALPTITFSSGLVAMDLATFLFDYDEQITRPIILAAQQRWQHRQIYAYVDAYASRTLVVFIPEAVCVAEPFYLDRFLSSTQTVDQYDAIIVVMQADAKATIVDRCRASDSSATVRSLVCHVGQRAQLTLICHQDTQHEPMMACAYALIGEQDSSITVQSILQSTTQTDFWLDLFLQESGARATVRGVYVLSGQARMKIITQQHHTAPHTSSDIALHGCLTGQAQATYHGRIHIAQAGQHAQAEQRNNSLLISDAARALSLPSLEALAHEVHCVHASAIGSIDTQALAYLVARGIPPAQARVLLIEGFLRSSLGESTYLAPVLQELITLLKEGVSL